MTVYSQIFIDRSRSASYRPRQQGRTGVGVADIADETGLYETIEIITDITDKLTKSIHNITNNNILKGSSQH